MVTALSRGTGIALALVLLTGCGRPIVVRLSYAPDPEISRLSTASAAAVTVCRFEDVRGRESDGRDPFRVGGIYPTFPVLDALAIGGIASARGKDNATLKIKSSTPWPESLSEALKAGLAQRGVEAVTMTDRVCVPGFPVGTPLVLGGEIQHFSVERRWTMQAHVAGIMRLWDLEGRLLLEKPVEARVVPQYGAVPYDTVLNEAVQQFVRKVVTDPDLTQRLVAAQ